MYVRRNDTPISTGLHKGGTWHKAFLHQSKWVDDKMKHRFIAYLGVYRMECYFYGGTGITY